MSGVPTTSVQDLAEALGLDDPEEFAKRSASSWRGTGRTTKMLLRALVAVAEGREVALAAHSMRYGEDLTGRLKAWAVRLKLNAELIRRPAYATGDRRSVSLWWRGRRVSDPPEVFEDHYAGEDW